MRLVSLWLSTLGVAPVTDKTNGETIILFNTVQTQTDREIDRDR